jgi:hypothetical protein
MSVSSTSSTSAPLPFNYLETNKQAAPATSAAGSSDTSSTDDSSQPPAPPPLPPGQGTRVNQLV